MEKTKENALPNFSKDMKILAIETTGKYGSASVTDETGGVFSACSSERPHSSAYEAKTAWEQ